MSDWSVGDWAYALSSEDSYWYPAEIIEADGNQYNVRYDEDESEEWLEVASLADYSTEPGEQGAEAWSEADESYYAVNVLEVNEEQIQVEYEDGTTEWMDLGNLRFAS